MENALKKSKFINLFIFIFINVFFLDYYLPVMLLFHISEDKSKEISQIFALLYILFVTINRLYLLPVYFKFLLKYIKNQEIKFFIHNLKLTLSYKIILLVITFFVSPILGTIFDFILNHDIDCLIGSFKLGLIFSPWLGLYQAYIILYLYWFVEDILINNTKKNNYSINGLGRKK